MRDFHLSRLRKGIDTIDPQHQQKLPGFADPPRVFRQSRRLYSVRGSPFNSTCPPLGSQNRSIKPTRVLLGATDSYNSCLHSQLSPFNPIVSLLYSYIILYHTMLNTMLNTISYYILTKVRQIPTNLPSVFFSHVEKCSQRNPLDCPQSLKSIEIPKTPTRTKPKTSKTLKLKPG